MLRKEESLAQHCPPGEWWSQTIEPEHLSPSRSEQGGQIQGMVHSKCSAPFKNLLYFCMFLCKQVHDISLKKYFSHARRYKE